MDKNLTEWLSVYKSELDNPAYNSKDKVLALDLDSIELEEWRFVSSEYLDAVLDTERGKYAALSKADNSFDKSDYAMLANDIKNGDIIFTGKTFSDKNLMCCYDQKNNEYIGISIYQTK